MANFIIVLGILISSLGVLLIVLNDDTHEHPNRIFTGLLLFGIGVVTVGVSSQYRGERLGAYKMLHHEYTIQYITDENHCVVDSIIKEFQ